eukprot:sb/3473441/
MTSQTPKITIIRPPLSLSLSLGPLHAPLPHGPAVRSHVETGLNPPDPDPASQHVNHSAVARPLTNQFMQSMLLRTLQEDRVCVCVSCTSRTSTHLLSMGCSDPLISQFSPLGHQHTWLTRAPCSISRSGPTKAHQLYYCTWRHSHLVRSPH